MKEFIVKSYEGDTSSPLYNTIIHCESFDSEEEALQHYNDICEKYDKVVFLGDYGYKIIMSSRSKK